MIRKHRAFYPSFLTLGFASSLAVALADPEDPDDEDEAGESDEDDESGDGEE